MSDLRIRSEEVRDDDWSLPFLPPAAPTGTDDFEDGVDFAPLLAALGRSLGAVFGMEVGVRPGRPQPSTADGAAQRVDPILVALLANLQWGGDPLRPAPATGAALARHAATIVAAIDTVAASHWPVAGNASQFDLEIRCTHALGSVEGFAILIPLPRAAPPPPRPIEALRHELMALPMRIRVELAGEIRMIASLLPLRTGQVLALNPVAEMPLIVGRHSIGHAKVTANPDGRQHAEIVAIGVNRLEGR